MKDNIKPLKYHAGIFDKYKTTPDLYDWIEKGFDETMWGLGYDMDCHESFKKFIEETPLKVKEPTSDRERRRNMLYYLEHAPRQVIGNCLFSEWRYLTHWSMAGYTEYDVDLLCRIINLLECKYNEES